MPIHQNRLLIIVLCLLVNACTQKSQDVSSTLHEAVFGFDSVQTSKQDIDALPYASSHVIINNGAQIFIVLALAEPANNNPNQTQLKWLSSDGAMLTTENGRLVKTLRLPTDNLANLTANDSVDPLLTKGQKPNHALWTAIYDWQPNYRFNYTANLAWNFIKTDTIHSAAWEKETDYYQEQVIISSLNTQFTNHFWLDKKSHQVVKSIQYLGPDMPSVEMTILKPFSE